jgi:hypothetical protein
LEQKSTRKFRAPNRQNVPKRNTRTISPLMSQHEISVAEQAFSNPDDHEGLEIISMVQTPAAGTPFLRRLGNDLVTHARLPNTFSLQEYFNERGIFQTTVDRWTRQDEYFKNCYFLAKEIIGTRREKWGAEKVKDTSMMLRYAAVYQKEFRDMKEWEAELASRKPAQPTEIKITLDRGDRGNSREANRRDMHTSVGDQTTSGETGHEETGPEEPSEPTL